MVPTAFVRGAAAAPQRRGAQGLGNRDRRALHCAELEDERYLKKK